MLASHRAVARGWIARCGVEAAPGAVSITNGANSAITAALMGVVPLGGCLAAEALTHHLLMPPCGDLGIPLHGVAIIESYGFSAAAMSTSREELCAG